MNRDEKVIPKISLDSKFTEECSTAVASFQLSSGLAATGIFDATTAQRLLDLHSADGIKDTGFSAGSKGYLYKINIPVHNNRSVETKATLFDKDNNVLMQFTVRSHGRRDDGSSAPFPDFGNGDFGLNQFTPNGNTVTGIIEVDLNSPEPDPTSFGPWPVNRFVRGLEGNALLLLPNIRDGILLHTGNWTTDSQQWDPTMTMPNSAGCVHGHPSVVEQIYKTLVDIGVTINDNTFSGKNYPYKPQGIAVVELID